MIVDYEFTNYNGEKGEATQLFSTPFVSNEETVKLIKRCDTKIRKVTILRVKDK